MGKFIVGLILGIAIAGGLAFYLSNTPNQIVNKVTNSGVNLGVANSSAPLVLAPGTKLQQASGVVPRDTSSAQNYDFYNILPGGKTNASGANINNSQSVNANSVFIVQAGVFTDQDSANDMKARLALLGIDSQIKSQQQDNKVINRVIVGPFASVDDANAIRSRLKNENIQGVVVKINN